MACRELVALAVVLGSGRAGADVAPPVAPGPAASDVVDHRLAERLTRLAERHYRAGEYYRAISAYEELALFTGDDATRLHAAVRIAMSYHHGHQLDDALAAYRTALALVRDGDIAQALRIQLAVARVERSFDEPGTEAFDVIAAELTPSTAAGRYRALALAQLARIEGLAGRRDAARAASDELHAACRSAAAADPAPGSAADPAPGSAAGPAAGSAAGPAADPARAPARAPAAALSAAASATISPTPLPARSWALSPGCSVEPVLARALERPPPARRSPGLGVALSLVVPGSGSVYGGHLVDGLYYFALTTLSGLGALDVYATGRAWTDQKVTFYGLTALAAIFYAGSAMQGYVSVMRHNAITELDARRALWRDTETPLPLEDIAPAP